MFRKRSKQTKRTRKWIFNATMKLLGKKPYDEIKIANITDEAGVARQSFYRNFDSKDDILRKYIEDMVEEYIVALQKECKEKGFDAAALYRLFFSMMQQNREELLTMKNASLMQIFYWAVSCYAKDAEDHIPMEADSRVKYQLGGIVTLAVDWINSGMTLSAEEMADRVGQLTEKFDEDHSLLRLLAQIDFDGTGIQENE